jgi:sortase A
MARTSRWDRPPAPRDLRWWVRLLGKVLIAAGLLIFGFVAYQLWGTGIQTARAQRRLGSELSQMMVTTVVAPPSSGVTTSAASVPSSTTPTSTTASVTATTAPVSTTSSTTTSTSTTTSSTVAPTTTIPTLDWAAFDIRHGDVLGTMSIPAIGVDDLKFVAGVDLDDLALGPGAYPETPLPGMYGNAALAGHRTTHGQPFYDLDQLEAGDQIVITMFHGGVYTYVVTGSEVVEPADRHVLDTVDPTRATLTLTTCTPKYSASQRLIVYATLADPAVAPSSQLYQTVRYWGQAPSGAPAGPLPGDADVTPTAPATTAAATVAATTTDAATSTSVAAVASTEPPSTAPTTTTVPPTYTTVTPGSLYSVLAGGGSSGGGAAASASALADDVFGSADAFDQGWFHDSGAIAPVIAWAAICIAVAVGAYQLAKWRRNSIIGIAVGAVPFVIALYFFYENVDRLLPAAI